MTVGEKIQYYRKKNGLSQEELGKKMLVSRQTISLWEMDKTMPTIDNLLRLKEIFSVSADDLLSEGEPAEPEPPKERPREAYVFRFEKEELNEYFKNAFGLLLRRSALLIALFTGFLIALLFAKINNIAVGIFFGTYLFAVFAIVRQYVVNKKEQKNSENNLLATTYTYEVFDGYFTVNIAREGSEKSLKVGFSEIKRVYSFKRFLTMEIGGQLYLLKKDVLAPGSVFFALCGKAPVPKKENRPSPLLKALSILLFILSVVSFAAAIITQMVLYFRTFDSVGNMWICFLFLPIPLASVAFGFYLKKRGYSYRMNVIVGLIAAGLLCIYGSFTFLFHNAYSHSDEPILRAEQLLKIDIPDHFQINTPNGSDLSEYAQRGSVSSVSEIYFKEDAVEDFEKNLPDDPKWLSKIPGALIGVTSHYSEKPMYDYFLIYNKSTKEFNKLPDKSGTYEFINLFYDTEHNKMKIVEYSIEYNK